jgi:hypothetical protein
MSFSQGDGCGAVQVTNYYDPSIAGSKVKGEVEQGKLLIDVAKEVGVKFLVWRFVRLASLASDDLILHVAVSHMRPMCRRGSTLASTILTVSMHLPIHILSARMRPSCRQS